MIYPIEQKSDLSGAMLVIRFPEEELDLLARTPASALGSCRRINSAAFTRGLTLGFL